MDNLSRVFQIQSKINMKRLSFITQFKIQFLLLLTSCKQVLGKMSAIKASKSFIPPSHCLFIWLPSIVQ